MGHAQDRPDAGASRHRLGQSGAADQAKVDEEVAEEDAALAKMKATGWDRFTQKWFAANGIGGEVIERLTRWRGLSQPREPEVEDPA